NKTTSASIGTSALVSAGKDISVKATSTEKLLAIAVSIGASGGTAVAASIIVVVMNAGSGDGTHATIGDATLSSTTGKIDVEASDTADKLELYAGDISVSAEDTTTIDGVAGQLAIGGSAGVGVGAEIAVVTKDTEASIAPSAHVTTTSGGNITVAAKSSEKVVAVAAGLAVSGSA